MWRWREVAMPDEYGNGSEGPCSTSSSTTRPTLTCSSSLRFSNHPANSSVPSTSQATPDYAIYGIMRLGLYSARCRSKRPLLETPEMSSKPDDLEAVRSLTDTLQPFSNDDRERIIRWAREKLGMVSAPLSVARRAAPAAPTEETAISAE